MNASYSNSDILKFTGDAVVIPVNCVGVMGAGLAKQFKERFPTAYRVYQAYCKAGSLRPGTVMGTRLDGEHFKYAIFFPTKDHWQEKADLHEVCRGLDALVRYLPMRNIRSIAIPALGCGLGGLDWQDVKYHILRYLESPLLDDLNLELWLYPPQRPQELR